MNRNLFVMRTQYNLIMGLSVLSTFVDNDENDLIVQLEFEMTNQLRESLDKYFDNILILKRSIGKNNLKKQKELYSSISLCDDFISKNNNYDRIIFAQERFLETMIFSKIYKYNKNVILESVEEDAYYSLNPYFNNTLNQKNWINNNGCLSFTEKICYQLFQLMFWKNRYWYPSYAYGMHPRCLTSHVQYPELVRTELKDKNIKGISEDEIIHGINCLYGNISVSYPDCSEYFVCFFDLMERYKEPEKIRKISAHYIKMARSKGMAVLVKYHPKEENKFKDLGDLYELDLRIPAEKVLLDLKYKNTTVFCNATTVGIIASKLGMDVISTAKLDRPENKELHRVWKEIGIKLLENYDL